MDIRKEKTILIYYVLIIAGAILSKFTLLTALILGIIFLLLIAFNISNNDHTIGKIQQFLFGVFSPPALLVIYYSTLLVFKNYSSYSSLSTLLYYYLHGIIITSLIIDIINSIFRTKKAKIIRKIRQIINSQTSINSLREFIYQKWTPTLMMLEKL